MTYLLISKNKVLQEEELKHILKVFFKREIQEVLEAPDLHILDKREENSIGIEDVKAFTQQMIFKPFGGDMQVAIVYEAEKLTPQAQNAFLKTLEESNDNTTYILCVDNEKNVLPTIFSRSKPIFVKQIQTEQSEIASEIPEILKMNLVEQFEYIENVSKEKQACLDLLFDLETHFKLKLENEIKNDNINSSKAIRNSLKYIQEAKDKINSNCNKKLVLEALFVYLNA